MKKFKKIVPIALGALALASCSGDDLSSNVPKEATQAGENEMIAVVGDIPGAVTRYGVNDAGTMYVWSEGDQYTVYDLTLTKNSEFVLDPDYIGSQEGLFTVAPGQEDIVDAEGHSTARYGVFPSRADNEILLKDHKTTLFMTLPASFEYEKIINGAQGEMDAKGGAVSPLPLWGSVANDAGSRVITFKMMTGVLKVDLRQIPANYSEVGNPAYLVVKSTKGHKLSGKFKADITEQSAEEYSADAADVELVKNTDPGSETDDDQIKVTFNTDGSKIDRVFFLPIPVGTYEPGDLTVELYDFNDDRKVDLTPEAWKATEVVVERGEMKDILYTFAVDITANSIAQLNNAIYNELVILNSKSTIQEGQTVTFNVEGSALTPTAEDNMLLIPTFEGKNINVILNIKNAIVAPNVALNIAEADYGEKSTAIDNQWKLKSGKTAESIKNVSSTALRTFTVNFGSDATGTVNKWSVVNVLAPTSNVYINTIAVDNTFKSIEATTANEVNSFQLGVDGKMLTFTSISSYAGGVFASSNVSVNNFSTFGGADIYFYGTCSAMYGKNGTGNLYIGKAATVKRFVNYGTGMITVDGDLIDSGSYPSLWNLSEAAITVNGTAETVKTKGQKPFIAGPGAKIKKLITEGSGDILVQGANVASITNNGTAAITVTEDVNGLDISLPVVATINNGVNGRSVNITANQSNLVITNKSQSSDFVVDFAYSEVSGGQVVTKTDGGWTATITDNSGSMTPTTGTGNMSVKNTSGLVTLTNIGGAVVLDNCSGDNVIVNNTENNAVITLTNSYAATLTNSNSNKAIVNTSGEAGIGTPTGAFTFVDAAWDGSSQEARNVSGNIYTAAQLAGLTQTATTETTITLKNSIDLGGQAGLWAGIKQGAMTLFDGANFTISELNLKDADKIGLFATAGTNDLTIQNLKLNTVTTASAGIKNCIGALVGEFAGSTTNSLVIKNVKVSDVALDAGSDADQSNSVAALVGKFIGKDLTFDGADITGTSIKGTSSLAGFVGNLGASNNVVFNASTLSGLTITVQGTPAESDAADAVTGRVGYLIGGVSGNVAYLKVYTNCTVTPAMTDYNEQRVAWKYKKRKVNSGLFFWGDENLYLGYCQGTISLYEIGDAVQTAGNSGDYNIYTGY